jgi:outer membrane protein assembly factor BamB
MLKNVTTADTAVLKPWTRIGGNYGDGKLFMYGGVGYENWYGVAYDLRAGSKLWETQLTPPSGYEINPYDVFNFKSMYANGVELVFGFGGDIWGLNATTGEQMWATNTLSTLGDPGIETPYGTWPLWIFAAQCQSANVAYFGIGHEYDPPLFHGAQMIALNMTDGSLIWKELGTYTRAFAIAYGVLISVNEYDNQVYGFAKGPTQVTVSAPSVGVTTATPITISGTVTDVSPGTEQSAVKLNFPNGVPCVSDDSQSHWMEYVYQQQLKPTNATGVTVTLSVIDANNNQRVIGTTTTNLDGTFGFVWTPDIPGTFNVIASFDGSNSYYPSSAETYFYASEAIAEPEPEYPQPVDNTMTVAGVGIAIIIAVAIVGIVLAMMLRRRP